MNYTYNHVVTECTTKYIPTQDYVTKQYIQSPMADRQEAAHYVHDHALSAKDLGEWL